MIELGQSLIVIFRRNVSDEVVRTLSQISCILNFIVRKAISNCSLKLIVYMANDSRNYNKRSFYWYLKLVKNIRGNKGWRVATMHARFTIALFFF